MQTETTDILAALVNDTEADFTFAELGLLACLLACNGDVDDAKLTDRFSQPEARDLFQTLMDKGAVELEMREDGPKMSIVSYH